MAIYRLSAMVFMRRKALKWTQDQLVEIEDEEEGKEKENLIKLPKESRKVNWDKTEICSTQVLRRIEKGNVGRVKIEIFRRLMMKMGVLPERMYASLLVTDSRTLNLRSEIHVYINQGKYEQAEQKLQKLEDKMIPNYPRNKQYLMERKATLDYNQKKISAEEYSKILWDALKCTVPMLDKVDIAEWPFSADEFEILYRIAIAYHAIGRREEELEFLLKLKKNVENRYMDQNYYVSWHTGILSRLSQFMCITDQYEKSMEYCEAGMKECREHRIFGKVYRFMYDIVWCRENRIRKGVLPEGEPSEQEEFIKKNESFVKNSSFRLII